MVVNNRDSVKIRLSINVNFSKFSSTHLKQDGLILWSRIKQNLPKIVFILFDHIRQFLTCNESTILKFGTYGTFIFNISEQSSFSLARFMNNSNNKQII